MQLARFALASLVTALVLNAAPVSAQSANDQADAAPLGNVIRPGTRIVEEPEAIDPDVVRVMQKRMARCVYDKHEDLTQKLLADSDQSAIHFEGLGFGKAEFGEAFSLPTCLGVAMRQRQANAQLRFQPQALRGLLAEEAYLAGNKDGLLLPAGSEEFLSTRFFTPSTNITQAKAFGAFTDCIVFHSPEVADQLLRTRPASDAEMSAVRALVPAVSNCLFEGQEFTLNAENARTLAADGLWSRALYAGTTVQGLETVQ